MPESTNPRTRPNIVFFMVDQLAAKWLEAGSASACPTPNLDELRTNGVTFSQAFTNNPICSPARSTIATGLPSRGHGVLQNGYELDPKVPTFMRVLERAGWRTGAFGKVHFRAHYHGVHPNYQPYGFQVVHNTEDPRAGEWLDWIEREHPGHYEAALATAWPLGIPELTRYGPGRIDLLSRIRSARERFQWTTPEHPANCPARYTLPFPEELSQTAWITRHARAFIRDAQPDEPICAHISYVSPHPPACPPARCMRLIDAERIPEPVQPTWPTDPAQPACFRASRTGLHLETPANWREIRHYYLADVAYLDEQLGLIVETLRESGRWDNTHLFYLSDHGEMLLDHGFTGKRERHYDACVRVPLVIAGPGVKAGRAVHHVVELQDICPTVLDMAGLSMPGPRVKGPWLNARDIEVLPGRSLLPLCHDDAPDFWRESAYIESYNKGTTHTPLFWARTIRTPEWRYTLYPNGAGEQLFSLRDDPNETQNFARDPERDALREEMRDRLLEHIIMQDYPHTPRNLYALGVH